MLNSVQAVSITNCITRAPCTPLVSILNCIYVRPFQVRFAVPFVRSHRQSEVAFFSYFTSFWTGVVVVLIRLPLIHGYPRTRCTMIMGMFLYMCMWAACGSADIGNERRMDSLQTHGTRVSTL